MLSRILIGTAAVAAVAAIATPATAMADPNVNAMPPISPVEYTAMEGAWYAFGAPGGLTCVIDKGSSAYGCSGVLPGAPNGANVVSSGPNGVPGFANSDRAVFGLAGDVNQLPPNSRLTFNGISCGHDGTTLSCNNSFNQAGFVIGPGGSYIVNELNPLLDRPEGTNPYIN